MHQGALPSCYRLRQLAQELKARAYRQRAQSFLPNAMSQESPSPCLTSGLADCQWPQAVRSVALRGQLRLVVRAKGQIRLPDFLRDSAGLLRMRGLKGMAQGTAQAKFGSSADVVDFKVRRFGHRRVSLAGGWLL